MTAYSNIIMVRCPFNALHSVPKQELRYHMTTCEYRDRVEKFTAASTNPKSGTYFKGCTDVPDYKAQHTYKETEEWDTEANQSTKVFVWGESFKFDPNLVGPDDVQFADCEKRPGLVTDWMNRQNQRRESKYDPTRLPKGKPGVLSSQESKDMGASSAGSGNSSGSATYYGFSI